MRERETERALKVNNPGRKERVKMEQERERERERERE